MAAAPRSARSSVTSPASRTWTRSARSSRSGRFLNRELDSVPDIDLDFPRDIREKLIVAVTERYGREHAALVASFSTYRSRGAIRDVGKALGLPYAELERIARVSEGWNAKRVAEELQLLPDADRKMMSPRWRAFAELCHEIAGLPRHISQHPGGMVISSRPLVELVPVQPAAMAGRQMCQWDKDSCSDAGFLKIDLLGLGMLSAVEDCVDQIAQLQGKPIDLSRIPLDDKAVYEEIQRADTIGDFQIESRAQMQSLLRTRPENIDDLTVQVALVRPGPIQGKAVHPYIDHRQRLREDPSFVPPVDHPLLADCLRSTLGVVVFQDQVLEVAIALAGFSVGEAEGPAPRDEPQALARRARGIPRALRRRRAAERRRREDRGHGLRQARRLLGLRVPEVARGGVRVARVPIRLAAAPLIPPSSCARSSTRSRWASIRRRRSSATASGAGWRHAPPDVNVSSAKCTVEDGAVRIGVDYVNGIGEAEAKAVVEERERDGPFQSVRDLAQRTQLSEHGLETLIVSGACDCFEMPRRQLLWQLGLVPRSHSVPGSGGEEKQLALPLDPTAATPELPEPTVWERMLADYRTTNLSVGVHPLELLRAHLPAGVISSRDLEQAPDRAQVAIAGMAVARQRPATANGVVFMLIEDEFGAVNLIVPPSVYDKHRAIVRGEPLILARGRFERIERNQNVLVRSLETLGPLARQVSQETEGRRQPARRSPLRSSLDAGFEYAVGCFVRPARAAAPSANAARRSAG